MTEDVRPNILFVLVDGLRADQCFGADKTSYTPFLDSLISDWSGISLEYAFTYERPVLFIDVPEKILNVLSKDISLEPIEIAIRNKIGHVISPNNLEKIPKLIEGLDEYAQNINEQIKGVRSQTVYNIGKSAKIGAEYIQQLNDRL